MEKFNTQLPEQVKNALREESERTGRPMSEITRSALIEHLEV
jgi:predicted DNA-binding protein